MMVSMTMASHHGAPQPWKVESVAPMRLNSGSRRFLKKSSMFRRFLFHGLEVSGVRSRTLAGKTRPLHPATEAGEEYDERAQKECYKDGKVARLASNAVVYVCRWQDARGDAAGCAEQREHRKAVLEVGVDLFPVEDVDEQAEQYEPESGGEDPPQSPCYDHNALFPERGAQARSPTKMSTATILAARTLSLALFLPTTMWVSVPLWADRGLREGPSCDKLHALPAGMAEWD